MSNFRALDITGDSYPEIFISVIKRNETWIEIYKISTKYQEIACEFYLRTESIRGTDINNDGIWDIKLDEFQTIDVNNDGIKDIVAAINTSYDRTPRGVIAFDGLTGKKIWFSEVGPHVFNINGVDFDQDRSKEIIFTTNAPCNGNKTKDMSDCTCYLVCLKKNGKILWKYEMGGKFNVTKYTYGDINNDGNMEIVCTYASGGRSAKFTNYELQIRDGITGSLKKYFRLPLGRFHFL